MTEISRRLGRHRSTLYREIWRNRSVYDDHYRATHAVWKAGGRKTRSRRNKRYGVREFRPVERLLRKQYSPQQVVGRLSLEGQAMMSHETIYLWIWADKAQGGTLWVNLRGASKKCRKRYGAYDSRGRLAGKRMIDTRPVVVERRSRIGDWEIDTVHGKGKACVVTLVERRTGLVRIGAIKQATKELTTRRTLDILGLERHPVKTITADNGCEFHGYKKIEAGLGTKVYFAQPHHAWERGSNENTNGLIRQYLPKGRDLSDLTQAKCNSIAEKLNDRPRKRLGFRTPNECYYL